jgi:hypothetical protein
MRMHICSDKWCDFISSMKLYPDFLLHGCSFLTLISTFGSLHLGDVDSIASVLEVHAASSSWLK